MAKHTPRSIGEAYPRSIPQKVLEAYPPTIFRVVAAAAEGGGGGGRGGGGSGTLPANHTRIIPEAYPKHACNSCGVLRVYCLDSVTRQGDPRSAVEA